LGNLWKVVRIKYFFLKSSDELEVIEKKVLGTFGEKKLEPYIIFRDIQFCKNA
jgi:hypothetical protein